jgi:hypothetical protein
VAPKQTAPAKVKAAIFALALYFLVLSAAAIVVGVHDGALSSPGLGVLVGSVILVIVGVVQFLAAYELVDLNRSWKDGKRPRCEWPVIAALLLTILLCLYVFLSALRTASTQRPYVTSIALALGFVALVGLRVFAREVRRTFIHIGTIALTTVGTTVGVWEFWYQSQYAPSQAGHAVTLRVGLDRAGERAPTTSSGRASATRTSAEGAWRSSAPRTRSPGQCSSAALDTPL